MTYETLLIGAEDQGIELFENDKIGRIGGLCVDNTITINSNIQTNKERTCVLAEELGHYYTTSGNILDQSKLENRKQERKARAWAYEKMIPLTSLLEAYWAGVKSRHDLAEFLEVTECFLQEALNYYRDKHGVYYIIDNYIINFEPLMVCKTFNTKG